MYFGFEKFFIYFGYNSSLARLRLFWKTARQDQNYRNLKANRAIDGKIHPLSNINNCAHAVGDWWIIDLANVFTLWGVTIYKSSYNREIFWLLL